MVKFLLINYVVDQDDYPRVLKGIDGLVEDFHDINTLLPLSSEFIQ